MKIEDLKIGMKVKAICGESVYGITNREKKWMGTVAYIDFDNGAFTAKTDSCTYKYISKGRFFKGLNPKYFEPVEEKKKITTMNEIPLKVTRDRDTVYVIYNGKTVAKATCSKDDTYDEEFGLNLALRRFCETLNNSHEIIITRRKIEYVEDFL